MAVTPNSYDAVPYISHPFRETSPENLATMATLFGMSPQDVRHCRVLELGCASAGNLLPMAERFPESEFIGVDLSARQIAQGESIVRRLGLKNVRLLHQSITEVSGELGRFDYIICHGVFSWVPPEVREKILAICHKQLNGQGVAYVSYNTYPGWHFRSIVRDLMTFHVGQTQNPADQVKQARAIHDFLVRSIRAEDRAYGLLLKNELDLLQRVDDSYLLHEHLSADNQPIYFRTFVECASRHGLQYLGEGSLSSMTVENLPPEAAAILKKIATSLIDLEQYMDFVKNRTFRRTLLCHADVKLSRAFAVEQLMKLSVGGNITADASSTGNDTVTFRHGGFHISTANPTVKAILSRLGAAWPRFVPFSELAAIAPSEVQTIGKFLIDLHAKGAVAFAISEASFVSAVNDWPVASPLARLQAETSAKVTSCRHEEVQLDDFQRRLIRLLDGTNNQPAIIAKFVQDSQSGTMTVRDESGPVVDETRLQQLIAGSVGQALTVLAKAALLIG